MANVSILENTKINKYDRLDADFYHPKYLSLESTLLKKKCHKLSSLALGIKCGPFGSTVLCETYIPNGTPIIRPFNLQYMRINGDIAYISEEDVAKKGLKKYKNEDIFLSRVGDIKCGLVYVNDNGVTISPNIIAIQINKKKVNPYYIATYLNTKYGFMQIERGLKQVAQPTIETKLVKNILVPLLNESFQHEIEKMVKEAFEFYDTSKLLYSKATSLLLKELKLSEFRTKHELFYVTNLSNLIWARRVDAEYFKPVYGEVIKYLNANFEVKKLGKLAYRNKIKICPVPQETYKYIEISDISTDIGEINYTERQGKELPPNARIPIHGGELIISKVRPTRGAIGIISKEFNKNVICSSAFSVFTVDSPLKEYLYIVVRSVIGKLQMERPTTGTSYPTINDSDVENVEIPILPLETQRKIASFVQQSCKARRKAKGLLKEAKKKVEKAI